jgi:hypothetical protein
MVRLLHLYDTTASNQFIWPSTTDISVAFADRPVFRAPFASPPAGLSTVARTMNPWHLASPERYLVKI